MDLNVRRPVRPLLAGAGIIAALFAGGCISIEDDVAEQPGVIGDVTITTKVCAEGTIYGTPTEVRMVRGGTCIEMQEPGGGEDELGEENAGRAATVEDPSSLYQVMLGYLVPNGTREPASFPVVVAPHKTGAAEQAGTYTEHDALAEIYEGSYPSGEDKRWVAYLSDPLRGHHDSQPRYASTAQFGLPAAEPGQPYRGPFAYSTVVGYRTIPDEGAATAPIDCAMSSCRADIRGLELEEVAERGVTAPTYRQVTLSTRDLAVAPAGTATITAGQSGDVPFVLRYAGQPSGDAFLLRSSTSIPGAGAAPLAATFQPAAADEEQTVGVRVNVPAGTPAGPQDVELVASLANGQTRRATGRFTVLAPAAAPAQQQQPQPQQQQQPQQLIAASSRSCVSRRSFTITLRQSKRDPLASAVVRVNGKKVKTVKRRRITAPVSLTGLPKGRFTVTITAKTRSGKTLTGSRKYRTCTPKRTGGVPKL